MTKFVCPRVVVQAQRLPLVGSHRYRPTSPVPVYVVSGIYRTSYGNRMSAIALARATDTKNPLRRRAKVVLAATTTVDGVRRGDVTATAAFSSTSSRNRSGIDGGRRRLDGRLRYASITCAMSSAAETSRSASSFRLARGGRLWLPRPPDSLRRPEPQRPLPTPATKSCWSRRRLVRGGRSGGGSASSRVSITYRHLSPSSRSGSAGNGPLMTGFFFLLLK